jgi:hypothetical protein
VCPGALLAALRFLLIHHQSRFGFSAICPFVLVSSLLFHVSLFCLFFGGPLQCPRPSLIHCLLSIWDFRPIQPRSTSRIYQKRLSGLFNFDTICCYHVFSRLLRIGWEPPQWMRRASEVPLMSVLSYGTYPSLFLLVLTSRCLPLLGSQLEMGPPGRSQVSTAVPHLS